MRQCKRVQELLHADYFDGQASLNDERIIKEHLQKCPQCRELEMKLLSTRAIFKEAKQQQVPEQVWRNIQQAIIADQLKMQSQFSVGIFQRLKDFLFVRKPAVLLATSFSMAIIFAIIVTASLNNKVFLSKQNTLDNISGYNLSEDTDYTMSDLGTDIEQYFL